MHIYENPAGRVAWLLGFIDLRELLPGEQHLPERHAEVKVCNQEGMLD
jgi:hypothetical protein